MPITSSICFLDAVRFGRRQVDLVEDGDDLMIVVDGLIDVGERLGFHTLRGVDHQQRAFTGRQRAGHFVRKVHVARRVDQVQRILFTVLGIVDQSHCLRLDRDAALAFDVHRIEHLLGHFAVGQRAVIWIRRSASVDLP